MSDQRPTALTWRLVGLRYYSSQLLFLNPL